MSVGIEFECPHCGRVTRVPADLARKQGRCAECRKILEVPDPDMEGSARRTSHLRHSDRAGFELASSSLEREPLPPQPPQPPQPRPAPAWDFGRVPVLMWFALGLGVLLPILPLAMGLYGVAKGHQTRVRELLVCGWGGLIEFQLIWLAIAVMQFGLFALPTITILLSAGLGFVHVRWVAKQPPDQRRSR